MGSHWSENIILSLSASLWVLLTLMLSISASAFLSANSFSRRISSRLESLS